MKPVYYIRILQKNKKKGAMVRYGLSMGEFLRAKPEEIPYGKGFV